MSFIVRDFGDACFVLNKKNFLSIFVEGTLSKMVSSLVGNHNFCLPSSFLSNFQEEVVPLVLDDFEKIRKEFKAILDFDKCNEKEKVSLEKVENQNDAFKALSDFSKKNWVPSRLR